MCNFGRTLRAFSASLALGGALCTVFYGGFALAAGDPVDEAAAEKARAYNRYYREVKKSKDKSPEALNRLRDRILGPAIVNHQKAMERAHLQALGQVQKESSRPSGKPVTIRPPTKSEFAGQTKKSSGKKKGKSTTSFSPGGTAKKPGRPSAGPGPSEAPTVGGTQRVDEVIYEGKKKKPATPAPGGP